MEVRGGSLVVPNLKLSPKLMVTGCVWNEMRMGAWKLMK